MRLLRIRWLGWKLRGLRLWLHLMGVVGALSHAGVEATGDALADIQRELATYRELP